MNKPIPSSHYPEFRDASVQTLPPSSELEVGFQPRDAPGSDVSRTSEPQKLRTVSNLLLHSILYLMLPRRDAGFHGHMTGSLAVKSWLQQGSPPRTPLRMAVNEFIGKRRCERLVTSQTRHFSRYSRSRLPPLIRSTLGLVISAKLCH
jgi:hypothetical protein